MRSLPLLLLLLATPALAQGPAVPPDQAPAPAAAATDPAPAAEVPAAPFPKFGFQLEAGVPVGATADLVYRPLPWLRLQAGPAWNYLAFGVQGGIVLSPIRWAISPVLDLRYGHFFNADLNKVATSAPTELQPLLSSFGYDYLNGQIALEFGSQRGFSFSVGMGLSYVWATLHGTGTVAHNTGTPDASSVTIVNPNLRAVIPSMRLGMLYFF
jgi:hypothetical protein